MTGLNPDFGQACKAGPVLVDAFVLTTVLSGMARPITPHGQLFRSKNDSTSPVANAARPAILRQSDVLCHHRVFQFCQHVDR